MNRIILHTFFISGEILVCNCISGWRVAQTRYFNAICVLGGIGATKSQCSGKYPEVSLLARYHPGLFHRAGSVFLPLNTMKRNSGYFFRTNISFSITQGSLKKKPSLVGFYLGNLQAPVNIFGRTGRTIQYLPDSSEITGNLSGRFLSYYLY